MNQALTLNFDNSYIELPELFYTRQLPTPVSAPRIIRVNRKLATLLGIDADWLASKEGVEVLAGNRIPEGAQPIATVYGGHQFGQWNPGLGDGRAILLGETLGVDGKRYDIQLKGAGTTPYSRNGDGRSPIGPVLREYLVSEAMSAMGISTTRSLAAVTTGETVFRDRPLPGGILTRVAESHIRIGTFQYFLARRDTQALRQLADHVISRHYQAVADSRNRYLALLDRVIERQAELLSQWQLVGFIHGVMNTDNMLVSGETIDYGPCAFMDGHMDKTCYSSIDVQGRYDYRNQPYIANWNLTWLAQSLVPLIAGEENMDGEEARATELAQQSIDRFPERYAEAYAKGINKKLGLPGLSEADDTLAADLLEIMAREKTDFTLTFRHLSDLANQRNPQKRTAVPFELPPAFAPWLQQWRQRLQEENHAARVDYSDMYLANPAIIPRNHLIEQVIDSAVRESDFHPFNRLVEVLENPYDYDASDNKYAKPPAVDEIVAATFCGT